MPFLGTDRFKLLRLLGMGGMGNVYLVFDKHLGSKVALKVLHESVGMDLIRFKSEFRSLADIKHPNLAMLHELIADGTLWFFTMEYVDGVPFDVHILGGPYHRESAAFPKASDSATTMWLANQAQLGWCPQPDGRSLRAALRQLCAGVHAMHRAGCVHRDLKPSNVLVTADGRVVVLDFGLTKPRGTGSVKGHGLSGTPGYMAPEQAMELPSHPPADWYAVGSMLYEILTGQVPFSGALIDVLLKKCNEDPPAPVLLNPLADPDLSEFCMQLLRRDPALRPAGEEILAWLGPDTSARIPRSYPSPSPAGSSFIGREAELELLHRGYRAALSGGLAFILVEGISGIGKTALVERALEQIIAGSGQERQPLILRGRCHERETLPFKAFDSIVDQLSHTIAGLSPLDQTRMLPDGIAYLSEVFPVLRRLESIGRVPNRVPSLQDATELRRQAFVALRELMIRLAHQKPVIAFIDDLQWADRDSYALLSVLLQEPGIPGLLLVATCRLVAKGDAYTTLLPEILSNATMDRVLVGPLPADGVFALVDHLSEMGQAEPMAKQALAEAVVNEAEGNPFFALEIIRYLSRVGLSESGNDDRPFGRVPQLEDLILERLRTLSPESQRLIQVMAVAEDPLPPQALAAAAMVPLGKPAWELGLGALVEARLIRRAGRKDSDAVELYHDRIGEAVRGSLDETTLQRLYRNIAHAIETWGRERTDMLARFWLQADDVERARQYARQAAGEARTKMAFDRAAQLYQTAIQLESDPVTRRELLCALGDCQASSGLPFASAEAYEQAAVLNHGGEALRLLDLAAGQFLRGGHIARGLEIIRTVLQKVGLRLASRPIWALFSVSWRLVWLHFRGLRFKEKPPAEIPAADVLRLDVLWSVNTGLGIVDTVRADDFLMRFLMLALKVGDMRRVAQGLAVLAGQLSALGRGQIPRAIKLVSEAEVLARRSADPAIIGLAKLARAMVRYFAGDFNKISDELVAVEEYYLAHCLGVGWELSTARSFGCFALRLSGRLRELCERFDRYTADADRTGDRFLATNLRTYQSTVWLIRGDPARAAREIHGILATWPEGLFHVQHFFHLYACCEHAIYTGHPEQGMQALQAAQGRLARSALLAVSGIRVEYAWIRGRVALARAQELPVSDRAPYLRRVRQCVRKLSVGEHQTAIVMAGLLEAGMVWLSPTPSREQTVRILERAVATAEAAQVLWLASSGRRWLGAILDGPRGAELVAAARAWAVAEGVADPDRLAHLVAPGFWRKGDPGAFS